MRSLNRIKIYLTISTCFAVLLGLLRPAHAWQANLTFNQDVIAVSQELSKSWAPQWSNIVAVYHLNEASGSPTVKDSSGLNHTGNVIGGTTLGSAGKLKTSASFDGSSGWIDIGNPSDFPAGTSPRIMCAWAKINSTSGGYSWAFAYGSPNNSQAMFLGFQGSDIVLGAYADDLRISGMLTAGVWTPTVLLMTALPRLDTLMGLRPAPPQKIGISL